MPGMSSLKIGAFLTRAYFFWKKILRSIIQSWSSEAALIRRRLGGIDARCFDAVSYVNAYPDVVGSPRSPLEDFIHRGLNEGRQGCFFDSDWYLNAYPDVQALGIDALDHYERYGRAEGRRFRQIVIYQNTGVIDRNNYTEWLRRYQGRFGLPRDAQQHAIEMFSHKPKISIIMPVFNTPPEYLGEVLQSILTQTYEHWELCIANDASTDTHIRPMLDKFAQTDPRIKVAHRRENGHISRASNTALDMATGEYVALVDHDDLLPEDALFWVVHTINNRPDADIIYSDEDKIDKAGNRFEPYFKSDFNYELFLAQNMISHFGVYRRSLVERVGGFREGLEGSQDHDLALRVLETSAFDRVVHIPRILYHWRAIAGSTALALDEKSYATKAGLRAVEEHLKRKGVTAVVTVAYPKIGQYRVQYALPSPPPPVSIIIAADTEQERLEKCLMSITTKSTFGRYEILVLTGEEMRQKTADRYARLFGDRVRVLSDDGKTNHSARNNNGAVHANGDYLIFLSCCIEIISPGWIEEMLSFGQQSGIGCVGAKLFYPDKSIHHAGLILGLNGVAGFAHRHIAGTSPGYFVRALHHQSLSAVSWDCLLVRKDVYAEVGGFDQSLARAFGDVDFCLRVREHGLRNVWTPYAELSYHAVGADDENTIFVDEAAIMQDRWSAQLTHDPAYNPNLTFEFTDFSYAWPPRIESGQNA